jgi:hypothetical protein
MRRILTLFTLIITLGISTVQPAFASPVADVTDDKVTISFPNTITFSAKITANANITSVVLEYGTKQLTCGEVIAKAFPQFSPGKSLNVEWTWDMRQSGSLPPGTTIWWHWRYVDETGKETVSNQQTVIWLDSEHNWKTLSAEKLNLHYYSGDQAFAQELLNAAKNGLEFNKTKSGLTAQSPVDLYVYANTNDLKDAILFEPTWVGGEAFPDFDIVILSISPSILDWGRNSIVHELTHILIGHLTFSCLGAMPTWLTEGLAVYSEPDLVSVSQDQLDAAIQNDTLISIRALSAGFSENVGTTSLSYSESYSIVKFLLESFGLDKMIELLTNLRDGVAIDDALVKTYGFDTDGLDDAWRKDIGAQPRSTSAQPTAQPTPTFVPTIVPISGAPLVNQSDTPTPVPTSSFNQIPTSEPSATRNMPPMWLTVFLFGSCCILVLLIGVVILGFVVRHNNRKGGNNVQ